MSNIELLDTIRHAGTLYWILEIQLMEDEINEHLGHVDMLLEDALIETTMQVGVGHREAL
jgi:hypothetical protein